MQTAALAIPDAQRINRERGQAYSGETVHMSAKQRHSRLETQNRHAHHASFVTPGDEPRAEYALRIPTSSRAELSVCAS